MKILADAVVDEFLIRMSRKLKSVRKPKWI